MSTLTLKTHVSNRTSFFFPERIGCLFTIMPKNCFFVIRAKKKASGQNFLLRLHYMGGPKDTGDADIIHTPEVWLSIFGIMFA